MNIIDLMFTRDELLVMKYLIELVGKNATDMDLLTKTFFTALESGK
jgi:hypothetical protein